jgi:multidrug efflux pump subunit AcrA (membrane-fusion protein)
VEVGQAVKEGQLLLEFDLDELNIRLDQAEAQLALAEGSAVRPVPKWRRHWRPTSKRPSNGTGQRKPSKVQQNLYEMGAISEVDFRQAREAYELSELQLNAAVAALEAAKKGEMHRSRRQWRQPGPKFRL